MNPLPQDQLVQIWALASLLGLIPAVIAYRKGRSFGLWWIYGSMLFIVALFAAPLIGAVPAAATAPALVVVGGLMLSSIGEIPWDDVCVAFPAFLTLIMIPLTFSIANGLAFGLTSYVLIHLACGRGREVPKAAYPLAFLLLMRFIYMGSRL